MKCTHAVLPQPVVDQEGCRSARPKPPVPPALGITYLVVLMYSVTRAAEHHLYSTVVVYSFTFSKESSRIPLWCVLCIKRVPSLAIALHCSAFASSR